MNMSGEIERGECFISTILKIGTWGKSNVLLITTRVST